MFCVEQTDREVSDTSSLSAKDVEIGQRQMIEARLKQIVENINDNRKQHSDTMVKFKKELEKQAGERQVIQ